MLYYTSGGPHARKHDRQLEREVLDQRQLQHIKSTHIIAGSHQCPELHIAHPTDESTRQAVPFLEMLIEPPSVDESCEAFVAHAIALPPTYHKELVNSKKPQQSRTRRELGDPVTSVPLREYPGSPRLQA